MFLAISYSLVMLLSVGSIATGTRLRSLPAGMWGGEHAALQVHNNGGEIELDCAHGHITRKIMLDRNGNFDAAGTYTLEHGGPARRDENPAVMPARYSGHVHDETMTLTISRGKEETYTVTLIHNQTPMLTKCR